MIAPRDVFVYINGHIKLRAMINVPAMELSNKSFPRNFPDIKKARKQTKPRNIQNEMDFFSIFFKFRVVFSAVCSETSGISIEDKELVIAVGKRIRGSAIPDRTPNTLNASSVE